MRKADNDPLVVYHDNQNPNEYAEKAMSSIDEDADILISMRHSMLDGNDYRGCKVRKELPKVK